MFSTPYIIGDRLNTANRSILRAVKDNKIDLLNQIADEQVRNGAHALDISAAASGVDEIEHLKVLLSIGSTLDHCRSIDTASASTVKAARSAIRVPLIFNCYSGALESSREMRDAIWGFKDIIAVVAVCINFQGTHTLPARRLDIAKRVAQELSTIDIAPDRIIFDPITVPKSIGSKAEQVTLETTRLFREKFPTSGVLSAVSNYSYGEDKRPELERAYVRRAKQYGANVFLLNALDPILCEIALGHGA